MLNKKLDKNGNIVYYYTKGLGKGCKGNHTVPQTAESKQKISEGAKKNWQNFEYQRKQNNARVKVDFIIITNGIDNKRHLVNEVIPEGWYRGRVYKKPIEEIKIIFKISNHYPHHKKRGVK